MDSHFKRHFPSPEENGNAAVQPLIDAFKLKEISWLDKQWMAIALGHIGDERAVVPIINEESGGAVRLWALANIGGGAALDYFFELIDRRHFWFDPTDWGLWLPVYGLFRTRKWGQAAADRVYAKCQTGTLFVEHLAICLCELGDKRGADEILRRIRQGTTEGCSGYALYAIGQFDHAPVRQLLSSIVDTYQGNAWRTVALQKSTHEMDRVFYAAIGLARQRDPAAIRPLVDVLLNASLERQGFQDLEATLYDAAFEGVVNVGEKAIDSLRQFAASEDSRTSTRAKEVLARLASSRVCGAELSP